MSWMEKIYDKDGKPIPIPDSNDPGKIHWEVEFVGPPEPDDTLSIVNFDPPRVFHRSPDNKQWVEGPKPPPSEPDPRYCHAYSSSEYGAERCELPGGHDGPHRYTWEDDE